MLIFSKFKCNLFSRIFSMQSKNDNQMLKRTENFEMCIGKYIPMFVTGIALHNLVIGLGNICVTDEIRADHSFRTLRVVCNTSSRKTLSLGVLIVVLGNTGEISKDLRVYLEVYNESPGSKTITSLHANLFHSIR